MWPVAVLAGNGSPQVSRAPEDRVPILLYHSVSSEAEPLDAPFTLAPALFREHLEMLQSWGANTLTVSEFVEHIRLERPVPRRSVLITFDDAYADTVEVAVPILLELGMTATVYVTTGFVDQTVRSKKMISWREVRSLHECGFEVGAHSESHRELDTVPRAQAQAEVQGPKQRLEQELSAPIRSYAYPHGYYTPALQRLVATSAYTSASAVRNAVSHPADDIYALSRLMMYTTTATGDLHQMVVEGKAPLSRPGRSMATRGWRVYRRVRQLSAAQGRHL